MKKIIALLFVAAMLCTVLVMPAAAAKEAPAITVSSAAANVGQTVTLNVGIENNPGIVSYTMELVYDDESLELVEIVKVNCSEKNEANGKANYFTAGKLEGDKTLFKATFKVLVAGEHDVSVNVLTIRDGNDNEFEPEVNEGRISQSCAHKWGKYKVTREATCARAGLKVRYCSVCGERNTASIKKLPHTIELQNAKEATCTEAGYTGDEYCTVCEKVVKTGTEIPAKGHSTETEIRNAKEATCTEAGYTGDTCCKDCGEVMTPGESIAAKGHTWGEYSHDKDGHWQKCTVCGANSEKAAHEGNPCSVCGYEKAGFPVILIVVIAVVVVAAAGACIYFFVIKKKKD